MTSAKKRPHWSRQLSALDACSAAFAWARKQPSAAVAWRTCKRGDWMLWIYGEVAAGKPWSDERKPLVRAACACARLAESKWPDAQREQIDSALGVVEAWAANKASRHQALEAINRLCVFAYGSPSTYAAYSAAVSASDFVYTHGSTACAACAASYKRTFAKCADICRRMLKRPALPRSKR